MLSMNRLHLSLCAGGLAALVGTTASTAAGLEQTASVAARASVAAVLLISSDSDSSP